jgi:molybdate transport system ATP-binding protein
MMKFHIQAHINSQFYLDAKVNVHGDSHFIGLSGPSGAGKSSLLACLAGIEDKPYVLEQKQGVWGGNTLCLPPGANSGIGLVFQQSLLFPHLSVAGNLQLAKKYNKHSRWTVTSASQYFCCDHLLARRVQGLSGGEAQRVALARALIAAPQVLLLDEPLSALDAIMRTELMGQLAKLAADGLRILLVSHDLAELATYTDTLLWMNQGRILYSGDTLDVLDNVQQQQEADSLFSILQGKVVTPQHGMTRIAVGEQLIYSRGAAEVGQVVRLHIPAREVSLDRQVNHDCSIVNAFIGVITRIEPLTNTQVLVKVTYQEQCILALISQFSAARMQLKCGETITARFKLR